MQHYRNALRQERTLRSGFRLIALLIALAAALSACGAGQTSTEPLPPQLNEQGELPLAPDDALTALARRECLAGELEAPADLPLALQDRREHGEAQLIFADGRAVVDCLLERSADGRFRVRAGGKAETWPASSALTIQSAFGPPNSVGIAGRVAESAKTVRILAGDRVIEASHHGGFYAASWRGSDLPAFVVAFDEAGNLVGALDQAWLAQFFRLRSSLE